MLQALLHAPKFVNWLDIGHSNCAADAGMQRHCLACALRILSERYWALGDNQNAIDEAVMMVENRLRAGKIASHPSFPGLEIPYNMT